MAFKPKKEEESGYRKPLREMTLIEIRARMQQEIEASEWHGVAGIHIKKILTMPIDEFRRRSKETRGGNSLKESLGVMRNGAVLVPDGYDGLGGAEVVDLRSAEMECLDYAAEKQYGDMPEAREKLSDLKSI